METQSLQSLVCRFISFTPLRCDSHCPKKNVWSRLRRDMVVFKLNIFFRLWMPYAKVTEVTCGLYPFIGGQGAITRDVGEGFPIHRRGRIFTCSSYAEEKRLARKHLRDLPCVGSTLNTMMQKYNVHICTFLFPNKNTAYVSIECIEYLPVPMIPENVSTNDIAQKDVYNFILFKQS